MDVINTMIFHCDRFKEPMIDFHAPYTRTMWYGSATTPIELFGPTRYQWDQA